MREKLKRLVGERLRVRATVIQYGEKKTAGGSYRRMICLGPVLQLPPGKEVADHVWLRAGPIVAGLHLHPGDVVEFDASVAQYWKGYVNQAKRIDERKIDYKLIFPANYEVISRYAGPRADHNKNQANGVRTTERVHG